MGVTAAKGINMIKIEKEQITDQIFIIVAKKINPKNNFGNTSHCAICQSIYHGARKCPDKYGKSNISSRVIIR